MLRRCRELMSPTLTTVQTANKFPSIISKYEKTYELY
jgi:hypothetical protein